MTKETRTAVRALAAAALALAALACDPTTGPPAAETRAFEPAGDGWVRFATNDVGHHGRAFLRLLEPAGSAPFEAALVKTGGYEGGDFGILFRARDERHWYLVSIDTRGNYSVKKRSGEELVDLVPWTPSPALRAGHGAVNTLRIEEKTAGRFVVSLNGTAVATAVDAGTPYPGGRSGYFVYVASAANEAFPGKPVEVLFKGAEAGI